MKLRFPRRAIENIAAIADYIRVNTLITASACEMPHTKASKIPFYLHERAAPQDFCQVGGMRAYAEGARDAGMAAIEKATNW